MSAPSALIAKTAIVSGPTGPTKALRSVIMLKAPPRQR